MAIQILTPQLGELMGPGYPLSVSTNIIGPIPQTAFWIVNFVSTAPGSQEGPILTQQISAFAAQHALNYVVGDPTYPYQPTDGFQVSVTPEETVRMVIALSNNSVILDQTSVDVKWDPTGRAYALEQMGGQIQGGFTTDDRQTIEATEIQTMATFPAQLNGQVNISFGLGDLVAELPSFLASADAPFLRTGRGQLTRPGGPFNVNALGIQWRWAVVPEFLGFRDGAVRRYEQRMLQLVAIGRDLGAHPYVLEVRESSVEEERMMWGLVPPDQLLYDILPGVTVEFRWLLV